MWPPFANPDKTNYFEATVLVLSGSTTKKDVEAYAFRPDYVVDSVADLCSARFLTNGTAA